MMTKKARPSFSIGSSPIFDRYGLMDFREYTRDAYARPMSTAIDRFRQLHESGCFVLPNPWDIGSARLLVHLGFPALATTSSGFAWSIGCRDNHVMLDEALAHFRALAAAVEVPVNADFEGGFAVEPDDVAANVTAAVATGIAGLSIED